MFGSLFDIMLEKRPAAPEALPSHPDFQGLEFLVGGIWVATPFPGTMYNESIQWTLDGQFMTSTQITCKPPSVASLTNGFLGVDSAQQLIVMWGFSNTGSFVNLKQVKPSDPNTWKFQGLVHGLMTQQTLTKLGPVAMQTVTATLVGGEWQAKPPVSYQRAS